MLFFELTLIAVHDPRLFNKEKNERFMMKLIIQIPCFNEEKTLGVTLSALPREIPGVHKVEWLIIDDGSKDGTVDVARKHGVDHIVQHPHNLGLARAFMTGLDACLEAGADIIVNTDADNQYNASDIPRLIEPILKGEAQMVVGARPIHKTQHFSLVKKVLQRIGSWVVRRASHTKVQDAPSGFRAINRYAASRLIVFNGYTYTLETLIQAGRQGISVVSVPVGTNQDLRPSRLVKSIPSYVFRSVETILRITMTYSPFRFFMALSAVAFLISLIFLSNFLYYFSLGEEDSHIPSVVIAGVFGTIGFFLLIAGLLADLMAINRKMLEDLRWRLFRMEERQASRLRQESTPEPSFREGNGDSLPPSRSSAEKERAKILES